MINILANGFRLLTTKNITIENYGYDTGIIEGTTGNHCVKCIAVNYCCFKDEQGKKPDKFNMEPVKLIDIILKGFTMGLYHPNCHCVERPIDTPSIEDIKLIIPEGKIWWLFEDKFDLVNAWGYNIEDKNLLMKEIEQAVKKSYISGNYNIRSITKYGVNATLFLEIRGINKKSGRIYRRVSSFMIYPNGKLKNNTLIGDIWWWKNTIKWN